MKRSHQVTLAATGFAFAGLAGAMAASAHSTNTSTPPTTPPTTQLLEPDDGGTTYSPPFEARPAPSDGFVPQAPVTRSGGS